KRLQIFLDELRAQMHIELNQRRLADGFEAVDLSRFDDENISCAALKCRPIDGPHPAPFANELDLIIRVAMRPRPGTRFAVEKKHGNAGSPLLGPDKFMRAADERQILLAHVIHLPHLLKWVLPA